MTFRLDLWLMVNSFDKNYHGCNLSLLSFLPVKAERTTQTKNTKINKTAVMLHTNINIHVTNKRHLNVKDEYLQLNLDSLSVAVHRRTENLPCLYKAVEYFTGRKRTTVYLI